MKRSSYRDQDYAFGQLVLTLRTKLGLTQASLGEVLGVSRRSVAEWENGAKYPTADHLKHFITFTAEQHAFPHGHEQAAIRELWDLSRQKVVLDNVWLTELLSRLHAPAVHPTVTQSHRRHVDWGESVAISTVYGRESELSLVQTWVLEERCRVVSVVGFGGIGKTTLTVRLMHLIADQFDVVIWRSLRDAPTCDALIRDYLQVLALQTSESIPTDLNQGLVLLLDHLRTKRVLMVLDNMEAVLETGSDTGRMRDGYEDYERLLRRIGESNHQSCLVFTSREKPTSLVSLEGNQSPVRALRLARLEAKPCGQLLSERGITGNASDQARLIDAYAGNPLALKIVSQTILDLFDGEIAPFVEQGEIIFGGIRNLLAEHFTRLSPIQQIVLLWLAILREPSTLDELLTVLATPIPRARLLEAVEALHRRSLVERGQRSGSFTLQSVVLEYATAQLIEDVSVELQTGTPTRLLNHALELAQSREYVRQTQERLIVIPVLTYIRALHLQPSELEQQLRLLLDQFRVLTDNTQGYAPANVVTLLRFLRGDLRGLDLTNLVLRGMYFQGIEMQDANLSGSMIRDSVFNQTFDALSSVAVSSTGLYWAAGSRHGEVRLWTANGMILDRMWHAHADMVCEMQFSPDGTLLATAGSWDGTVKLWNATSGALLWSVKHGSQAYGLTFSPDGRLLTTTGYDATAYIWDMQTHTPLHILAHPDVVTSITWSPDGRYVVTGDLQGCLRWWTIRENEPATCTLLFNEHNNCVEGLAFSPDGSLLASASWDNTVKLWDVVDGSVLQTHSGHTNRVTRLAWSPDGNTLASAGRDQTIWLWDRERASYRVALHGHNSGVQGLTFTPDNEKVLTVSEDGALRVSKVSDGQSLRLMLGYAASLNDADWSPDGTHLVSGGSDTLVTIYAANGEAAPRILHGHLGIIIGAGWSRDGRWLATSEWNNAVRLWDVASGECVQILHYPGETGDYFDRLAWSPTGHRLAIGTYKHGIQLFDVTEQHQSWLGSQLSIWIRHVAWHPDGVQLAGGGADGAVYIWDTSTTTQLQRLIGHHSTITDIAWSPDGSLLASGSRGLDGGELFIWDVNSGERLHTLQGHPMIVYAVTWSADENVLMSGDSEGNLRWWDIQHETCIRTVQAHQGTIHSLRLSPDTTKLASCGNDGTIRLWDVLTGEHLQTLRRDRLYERLNITGIKGLTDAQKQTLRELGAVEDIQSKNVP